jgi:hypothetical protein
VKARSEARILQLLRAARRERDAHARDCPAWDYESDNCLECADHAAKVRELRLQLGRVS